MRASVEIWQSNRGQLHRFNGLSPNFDKKKNCISSSSVLLYIPGLSRLPGLSQGSLPRLPGEPPMIICIVVVHKLTTPKIHQFPVASVSIIKSNINFRNTLHFPALPSAAPHTSTSVYSRSFTWLPRKSIVPVRPSPPYL